jgi:hypothetical protein
MWKTIRLLLILTTKVTLLIFSSGAGLFAGGILVTFIVALMNYLAEDGPIFPAPLVAFAVIAPVSFILFGIQCSILIYEWIAKCYLVNWLLWIGIAGGLVAGLIPYFLVISPYVPTSDYWPLLSFSGLGIFMGLIVFSIHWSANRVMIIFTRSRDT